jgi:predicted transcriptional regulator
MQNILEEERIHFGKWDIEFEKKRMLYDGTEIVITDLQWDILQLLMSDSELSFSIKEIAYATNIGVDEAKNYVEDLLKTIKEQTGSAIVQKKEERYAFVEITD